MEDMLLGGVQIQIVIQTVHGVTQVTQIREITGSTVIQLVQIMIFVAINLQRSLPLPVQDALRLLKELNAGLNKIFMTNNQITKKLEEFRPFVSKTKNTEMDENSG